MKTNIIIEKGRAARVALWRLVGPSSFSGVGRRLQSAKWILRFLTPLLLFFCEVRYHGVLLGIKTKYGLRALGLRLSHLLRVVFLQSRYVIRVVAEEILCLHGGKCDRNSGGHNNLGQQPTRAVLEPDASEAVEQRNGKESRNEDHVECDNGLSERGHSSLPNVKAQP